jgi:hypothetical protein
MGLVEVRTDRVSSGSIAWRLTLRRLVEELELLIRDFLTVAREYARPEYYLCVLTADSPRISIDAT